MSGGGLGAVAAKEFLERGCHLSGNVGTPGAAVDFWASGVAGAVDCPESRNGMVIQPKRFELTAPRIEVEADDVGAREGLAHECVAERSGEFLAGRAPGGRELHEWDLALLLSGCHFALQKFGELPLSRAQLDDCDGRSAEGDCGAGKADE